tara:strand:+ start:2708 stop:3013 length:306 start_codon:yes stop_codon:yes gene_type:complete
LLKISEVFTEQIKETQERPDGTEYASFKKVYNTRECLLNKEYIVSVSPYKFTSSTDLDRIEGVLPAGTKFSTFVMNGNTFRSSEIIVVGSFDKFCRELQAT